MSPLPKYVMESQGEPEVPSTEAGVYFDHYFPGTAGVSIAPFFWQFWICPLPGATGHFVVDTPQGNHTFLLGTEEGPTDRHRIKLFLWDGTNLNEYLSDACDAISSGEWAHVTVSVSNNIERANQRELRITIDGDLSGYYPNIPNPVSFSDARGLFFFGFNHQAWRGRMAWAQHFKCDAWGSVWTTSSGIRPAFVPQIQRYAYVDAQNASVIVRPDFSPVFNVPGIIPDLAPVFPPHPGMLYNEADVEYGRPSNEHPFWLDDQTCPAWSFNPHPVQEASFIGEEVVPSGSPLIYDSFGGRRCSRIEEDTPNLGSTEGGSLGPLEWTYSPTTTTYHYRHGIRNGYCIYMGQPDLILGTATVDSQQTTGRVESVMASADVTYALNDAPAVVFRCVDNNPLNKWVIHANRAIGLIYVRKYVNGAAQDVAEYTWAAGRNAIAVEYDSNNLIKVYSGVNVNGTTTWDTMVGSLTNSANNTGTWVGIVSLGNSVRRKSFTVYPL